MNEASKQIYGVLGYPAKHSLSPLMHNAAFKALGINAEYKIFEIEPQNLEKFVRALAEQNICGINVTIPYKEKVIPFLESISFESRLIGAVNTIKVTGDKLEGFNTDGEGFLRDIFENFNFEPRAKIIAIVGAGGAAKAVSVYLSKNVPRRVAIYDIDQAKSKALISRLHQSYSQTEFVQANSIAELDIPQAQLLVNATAVGMKESDPVLVDAKLLHKDILVYDLIYNPKETKLLKAAREKGALTSNGLGMLICQGMISFKIWTGKNPPEQSMREALLGELHA